MDFTYKKATWKQRKQINDKLFSSSFFTSRVEVLENLLETYDGADVPKDEEKRADFLNKIDNNKLIEMADTIIKDMNGLLTDKKK